MNQQTPPTAGEAVTAGDAAAAEVGAGDVGTTTAACDVLCVGVFFDGTNNSRADVGTGDINWHTNVDFLEHLYAENPPPIAPYAGQDRRFYYGKQYFRGIAVDQSGDALLQSGAIGTGEEGVRDRVDEAIPIINALIDGLAAGKQVCNVVLDVFGFSRGATAARYFCNRVKQGDVGAQHPNVDIRFLGLFDSVSSVYFPGNAHGGEDLPLTTSNLFGTHIYHITAEDELRYNFPLTRTFGREVAMVGSHSDIGGGRYAPGVMGEGHFYYSPYTARGTHEWIMDRWDLRDAEFSSIARNDMGDMLQGPGAPVGLLRGNDRATFHWRAEHGLQNVSLRLMFDEAKRQGLPFPDAVPNSIAGQDVSLHGDLTTYYQTLAENGGVCTDAGFKDRIRRRYCLFCGANDQVNAPEATGVRRSARL